MKKAATIILNRNLPEPTDRLVHHLQRYDFDYTDIFVVEAGSDEEKLSKFCTWHPNTPKIRKEGFKTIELDMSEFQKANGGPTCLSIIFKKDIDETF